MRLLYVHSRKASFIAIDRNILAERFEIEDLYQPGRWPNPVKVVRGVLRADLIQQLMCQGEIDVRRFEKIYGISFGEYFRDSLAALRPLQDDGLVQCPPGWIRATPRGRALLRIIAMCFDRYLGTQPEGVRYSKAI